MGTRTLTASSLELRATAVVLRAAALLAALAATALLVGFNGFGLLAGERVPGATDDASVVMNERTALTGTAGSDALLSVHDRLGSIEARSEAANATPGGSPGVDLAEVYGPVEVSVSFWGPSPTQRWAWLLVRALPLLAAAVALWLLADLTRSARLGDPFTRANVRRLDAVTALVLVGGAIGEWGGASVRRWLLDGSDVRDLVPVDLTVSLGFIGIALVLAVITSAWRRGVAMRQDLDGLV